MTIIAVAKTFGSALVLEALRTGVPDVGENYVQELLEKQEQLSGEQVRWHFIGHLQTRKVRSMVERVTMIHSVDSVRLGREIAARAPKPMDVLVEVNTSGEGTKFGVSPQDAPGLVRELSALPGLRVAGLMTIGPFLPDPEDSRPAFRKLAEIRRGLADAGLSLPHLSMGMTNDFEVAIEEGSTMVRIGTAIFGRRTKQPTV